MQDDPQCATLDHALLIRDMVSHSLLCAVQKNIDKIQGNLAELEAKLKHEQEKFRSYSANMQDAETR